MWPMLKPSTLTILPALVSPCPGLRQMSLPKRCACVLSTLGDRRVGMEAEGGPPSAHHPEREDEPLDEKLKYM